MILWAAPNQVQSLPPGWVSASPPMLGMERIDSRPGLHMHPGFAAEMSMANGEESQSLGELAGSVMQEASTRHASKYCEHNKQRRFCKDCGGSALCIHHRNKSLCRECGGAGICEHNRRRTRCKECGGAALCVHGKQKDKCKECGGASVCEHNRQQYSCKDCRGAGICEHNKQRRTCRDCRGSGICAHNRDRYTCKDCRENGICEHNIRRRACKNCKGQAEPPSNAFDMSSSDLARPPRIRIEPAPQSAFSVLHHDGATSSQSRKRSGARGSSPGAASGGKRQRADEGSAQGELAAPVRIMPASAMSGGVMLAGDMSSVEDSEKRMMAAAGLSVVEGVGMGDSVMLPVAAPRVVLCQHGLEKNKCKVCGGGRLCMHNRNKSLCRECGGAGICEHNRRRTRCKECGGAALCVHGKQKDKCKECGGASVCEHNRQKYSCKECGGGGICEHNKQRRRCRDCRGSGICAHNRDRYTCKYCGAGICEHNKQRRNCRVCKPQQQQQQQQQQSPSHVRGVVLQQPVQVGVSHQGPVSVAVAGFPLVTSVAH